jgi:beta-glucosidase
VRPSVFREPSGRACDGYRLWREDVDLAAGMGLNAYRFSIEWSRVEPAPGVFDEDALAHYGAIMDRCHAYGLATVVTFNHLTSPHWFAMRGGWLDPSAPSRFGRYCGAVLDHLGGGIDFAVTLNEPNLPRLLSWNQIPPEIRELERATLTAAAEATGVKQYRMSNVVLEEDFDALADGMTDGHRAARATIKNRRPDLPVGFSLAVVDDQAVGDPAVRDRKRAEVYDRWLRLARDDDFLGVQNYERARYDAGGPLPPPADAPRNQMGSDVYPPSLGGAVRYAYAETGVPILVTEHGIAHDDDRFRAGLIEPALTGLLDAIDDGVPVLGYVHWSLLDNFEWIFGYDLKLGLHEVDRDTFTRTAKPSAGVYAAIARANAVQS